MHDPIHDTIELPAPPERIYRALIDSEQFAAWSGAAADIGASDGDAFSCFDSMIAGRNIELVPNQRIVQAWRVFNWQPGVFSIVRFELTESDSGTRLNFSHVGFPPEHREHLNVGWAKKYWAPLRTFLG